MNISNPRIEPIDYLVIGHITQDVTSEGLRLGGTATYSALTAKAIGLRPGIVTCHHEDLDLTPLYGIPIISHHSEYTTTFKNINSQGKRTQYIQHRADPVELWMVPETWKQTPIVHFGPVAQEIPVTMIGQFNNPVIGLTPQGWFRSWDTEGKIHFTEWPESALALEKATAAILSIEDVGGDQMIIDDMLSSIRILALTEASSGSRLYWNGDIKGFKPPPTEELDPTGAGDIFATSFFIRYAQTKDPWESARFATLIAANSVTRPGLAGIPTPSEVQDYLIEVLQKY